jgi:hypothetical protein
LLRIAICKKNHSREKPSVMLQRRFFCDYFILAGKGSCGAFFGCMLYCQAIAGAGQKMSPSHDEKKRSINKALSSLVAHNLLGFGSFRTKYFNLRGMMWLRCNLAKRP